MANNNWDQQQNGNGNRIVERVRKKNGAQKIDKIIKIAEEEIKSLHIGVLCNIFEPKGKKNLVEQDLTAIGKGIQKALEKNGHKVTFFDLNHNPLPLKKLQKAEIDMMFNVCERVNDCSLLEPHAASLLDIFEIPYTGSNPQTLALCIDKIRVKKLLNFHGIPTPNYDYIYNVDDRIRGDLKFPLIVKPANTDNSIGITNDSVVTNWEQLKKQVEYVIKKIKRPALIEEFIDGDEIDVSIIGNDNELTVLPMTKWDFSKLPENLWHIFPFEAKWEEEDSPYYDIEAERPAKIGKRLEEKIKKMASDTYNILDCHDYGRVEIRVDKEGNPFVLELNPNPSIGEDDCVPGAGELIGMDYPTFIETVVKLAIQRYKKHPPYYHLQSSV